MAFPAMETMTTKQVINLALLHILLIETRDATGIAGSDELLAKANAAKTALMELAKCPTPKPIPSARVSLRLIQGGKP